MFKDISVAIFIEIKKYNKCFLLNFFLLYQTKIVFWSFYWIIYKEASKGINIGWTLDKEKIYALFVKFNFHFLRTYQKVYDWL